MRSIRRQKWSRAFEKNAPELRALLTGQMPAFVTQRQPSRRTREVPVLVFHAVEPSDFEAQLRYLQANNYRTLSADDVEATLHGEATDEPVVALTFDDATWTFWSYAFPLLKKYHCRAILFVIAGIVPEDATRYPNLDDLWAGTCSPQELALRGEVQPLCTWGELAHMHDSGLVDIESHSLTHARVPIKPRLVDFLHPDFDTDFYANVNVPISSLDDPAQPERALRLGAPVFQSAPRLACQPRFKEEPALVEAMTGYVKAHGGRDFFNRSHWRQDLMAVYKQWPAQRLGRVETLTEMASAVRRELAESKALLEAKLADKEVRHFCYPWFAGSETADCMAAELGYRTLYYGLELDPGTVRTGTGCTRIRRLSQEYLFRLPGDSRASLWSVWKHRVQHFVRRQGPRP